MLDILAYRRKKNKDRFEESLNHIIKKANCYGELKIDCILIDNDKNLINIFIKKLEIKIKQKIIISCDKDNSEANSRFKIMNLTKGYNNNYILYVENIYYEIYNKKDFLMYIDKNFFKVNYGLQTNKVIEPKVSADIMRNLLNKKSNKRNNAFSKSNIRRVPKV